MEKPSETPVTIFATRVRDNPYKACANLVSSAFSKRSLLFSSSTVQQITEGKILNKLYDSPSGPIYPLDVIYGYQKSLHAGNDFMSHKNGFTVETLVSFMKSSNFKSYVAGEAVGSFALWLIAYKNKAVSIEDLTIELKKHVNMCKI